MMVPKGIARGVLSVGTVHIQWEELWYPSQQKSRADDIARVASTMKSNDQNILCFLNNIV